MKQPEERSATDAPPEEREEDGVVDGNGRAAPIDEDVAGELNAALPDDHANAGKEDAHGVNRRSTSG
jgi:hypothetical protein